MTLSHSTPFAGSWYPRRRAELESLLDKLFDASLQRIGPCLLPRPLAFVVPHAGLAYSGAVAASAYRHLRASPPGRVFILGFTHRGGTPGLSIPDIGAFQTPLGEVAIDQGVARDLTSAGPFVLTGESRVCDHSVEIQLPLLQKAVPGVPVVAIYVGRIGDAERRGFAQALAHRVAPGDVLLASSDLTHYGRDFGYQPFAADADTGRRLSELDAAVIDSAGSLDPVLFLRTLSDLGSTVCGSGPIALMLETLDFLGGDDAFQQTLDYQTSAEITGDIHHSVSYASLGYFRSDSFVLDAEAQAALLASARAALRQLRATGQRWEIHQTHSLPSLARRSAAFVSLHEGGELFGCVGRRTADRTLAEAIPELTLAAALDDPRFPSRDTVPDGLDIEISVLSPMKPLRDWRSFRLGRDGASLEYGVRRGLLLPQVSRHGDFTQTLFLEALCRKAGLPRDAYCHPEARLSVFRAQVFGCPADS